MADEQTQTATTTTTEDATGTTHSTSSGQTAEKTFTQAELERIVKERVAREQTKATELAQKARSEAEAKALAEQGNYKQLFEKQQADLQAAADRIKTMELNTMRRDVASRVGLPAAFVDRLRGETEAEIEADAKLILEVIPKALAPNINSTPGGKAQPLTVESVVAQKLRTGMYAPL